ncbi:MAG: hypothetical protein AAF479_04075 [Pseudomonadota bacterium]
MIDIIGVPLVTLAIALLGIFETRKQVTTLDFRRHATAGGVLVLAIFQGYLSLGSTKEASQLQTSLADTKETLTSADIKLATANESIASLEKEITALENTIAGLELVVSEVRALQSPDKEALKRRLQIFYEAFESPDQAKSWAERTIQSLPARALAAEDVARSDREIEASLELSWQPIYAAILQRIDSRLRALAKEGIKFEVAGSEAPLFKTTEKSRYSLRTFKSPAVASSRLELYLYQGQVLSGQLLQAPFLSFDVNGTPAVTYQFYENHCDFRPSPRWTILHGAIRRSEDCAQAATRSFIQEQVDLMIEAVILESGNTTPPTD